MNEDFLITDGGALKSLSDTGKVGGYLVLFGSDNVDLQGEYFSSECDFWLEGKALLPLIFDHGRSPVFRRQKLTHVMQEKRSRGVWVEGKLPIRESESIERLWEAVKADQLGLSSGSSGHLVDRRKTRSGLTEIIEWPISEASLAPAPAQPRSRAMALKSLPPAEFGNLNCDAEQKAARIYAECLVRGHEMRMQGLLPQNNEMEMEYQKFKTLERSLDDDSRLEEKQYYLAMALRKLGIR